MKLFLKGLEESHAGFGVEVHAHYLMGNHYHLLLRTPQRNLSRAMRHIDGLYTQRNNLLKETDGALLCGRYKAILIDASGYIPQVRRYIQRNPVEARPPPVQLLRAYRWSSSAAYLDAKLRPTW